MTESTVTTDGLEALEIAGDFTTKITLNHPLVLHDAIKNLIQLLFGEFTRTHICVEARLSNDLIGPLGTDAINVAKRIGKLLLRWNINTKYTWHNSKVL